MSKSFVVENYPSLKWIELHPSKLKIIKHLTITQKKKELKVSLAMHNTTRDSLNILATFLLIYFPCCPNIQNFLSHPNATNILTELSKTLA